MRSARGLKITEACDLIGISRATYYSIKDRGQPVSEKVMDRVLSALDSIRSPKKKEAWSLNYTEIAPLMPPSVRESTSPNLSKAEVRVLVGEIKVRLEMIQSAFENMADY